MRDEALSKKLNLMLDKPQRSLSVAQKLLRDNDIDDAAAKAYYAAFHAMQAVLLSKGLVFSKHAGVKSALNREFIRTEIFPQEVSKKIERLFEDRQIADYGYEETISLRDASQDVADAQEIIETIKDYLQENNFL